MVRKTVFVLVGVLWSSLAASQDAQPDYQFRVLLHEQAIVRGPLGIAAWGIIPDAVLPEPFKALGMGGFLVKRSSGWLELLAGSFVDENGRADPVFNLRALRRAKQVVFYAEFMHTFPRERILFSGALTVPFRAGRMDLGVGVESDLITKPQGTDSYGAGPRFVISLPWPRKTSLATAYQWQSGRSFLRHYFLVNF